MIKYLGIVSFAALLVFFGAIPLHLYLTQRCFSTLRKNHADEYERLGKPHLFLNNGISNNLAFFRFVRSGRYKDLGDPELLRLINGRRLLWRIATVALALFVITLIWSAQEN